MRAGVDAKLRKVFHYFFGNGGGPCFFAVFSQSIPAKNGCFMISLLSATPILLKGSGSNNF